MYIFNLLLFSESLTLIPYPKIQRFPHSYREVAAPMSTLAPWPPATPGAKSLAPRLGKGRGTSTVNDLPAMHLHAEQRSIYLFECVCYYIHR
jgi:hypothetical protein